MYDQTDTKVAMEGKEERNNILFNNGTKSCRGSERGREREREAR